MGRRRGEMVVRHGAVVALAVSFWAARGAAGEDGADPSSDTARAQELDRAAERAADAGRYDEAIRAVQEADRIVPSPIHILNLGMINEQACRVTAAIANFFEFREKQDCDHVPEGMPEARYCEDALSRIVHEKELRQSCGAAAPPSTPLRQPGIDPAARRQASELFQKAEASMPAGDEDEGAARGGIEIARIAWERFIRVARCGYVSSDPEIGSMCRVAQRRVAQLRAQEGEAAARRAQAEEAAGRRARAEAAAQRRRLEEERRERKREREEVRRAREEAMPPARPMSRGAKLLAVGVPMLVLGVAGTVIWAVEGVTALNGAKQLEQDAASAGSWTTDFDQRVASGKLANNVAIASGLLGTALVIPGVILTVMGGRSMAREGRGEVALLPYASPREAGLALTVGF